MSEFVWLLGIVGFLMLLAEVFLPGAVMGILGGICLFLSIVVAYSTGGAMAGTVTLIVVSVGSFFGFLFWLWWFPKSHIGKKMTLQSAIDSPENTSSVPVGASGVALSALRPSGTARLNGRRVDVVTNGEFLESGAEVIVESIQGIRVVVKRALPG